MAVDRELSGDDIRAIRQDLGLTQVEAGELIGGGPRAFTKYEAGTVKPSAAIGRLLRILEADPGAISTLQGDGSRPLRANVSGPFEITGDHVAALTERLLPNLLRRLLSAEAQTHHLPADGTHVASNIHAADGGEDGRIMWTGGPAKTPYLPSRFCQFQLKAGDISPSATSREVVTGDGAIKSMVRKALEADGHYIVLSTRPYTQKRIVERETKIRDALRKAGLSFASGQVQVRDADQVAAWANAHSAVATWLRELTQPGSVGPFRSWSHWAGRPEHDGSPWVDDERLGRLRDWLLESLHEPRSSLRVVGPAGIGKSRLVNEALGPTDLDERTGLTASDLVLYADEAEVGPRALYTSVQRLVDAAARAIIVVDHCTVNTHKVLSGTVMRQGSRLSLVTIGDYVPDESPDLETFRVDEASPTVIEAIVERTAPGLPREDRRRLARFARGFPEIASCVGHSWSGTASLAQAADDTLVDAYVLGREPCDRQRLLAVAQLLAAFGAVRVQPPAHDELPALTKLAGGLAEAVVRSTVNELVRRSAVKRRGSLIVVQPLPIALNLAERQWRAWGPTQWEVVLTGGAGRNLQQRAARQLAHLNTTEVSEVVLRNVCRTNGPFDGPGAITDAGHAEVLTSLAEIDPETTGAVIERSMCNVPDLAQVSGDARRHLVRALERVAFPRDSFDMGAKLLLRLAAAENETWSNNATGQFARLFPSILGNTAADGEERLDFLNEALAAKEATWDAVIVEGLIAGCRTGGFSRMVGPEAHGSRPALEPWLPPDKREATAYLTGCVDRLSWFAKLPTDVGAKARAGLGYLLDSLLRADLLDAVETATIGVRREVDSWPEAGESLGRFLRHSCEDTDPAVTERVVSLLAAMQPDDLRSNARALLTEMPWNYPADAELDLASRQQRQRADVRALAEESLTRPVQLRELVPDLSRGSQRMTFHFGHALAEFCEEPSEWLETVIAAAVGVPEGERNLDLLVGFVVGASNSHPQVDPTLKGRLADSPDLAPALPAVCWNLGITAADISLVIAALRQGFLQPQQLMLWGSGSVLATVEPLALATLLDELLEPDADAITVALELMGMYALSNPEALDGLRPQIRKVAEGACRPRNADLGIMEVHHFKVIMTWILKQGRRDTDAQAVALTLSRGLIDDPDPVDDLDLTDDRPIESLLPRLLADFPEISWSLIGQAIVSDQTWAWHFEHALGSSFSFDDEADPEILSLPEDVLFAWCHAHPNSAPQFAAAVLPVLARQPSAASHHELHPAMARLLDEFGDRQPVLDAVTSNIHTFGWTGSFTTYFARFEEPLQALVEHPKVKVRRWARKLLRRVHSEMDKAHKDDEEVEARRGMYG